MYFSQPLRTEEVLGLNPLEEPEAEIFRLGKSAGRAAVISYAR